MLNWIQGERFTRISDYIWCYYDQRKIEIRSPSQIIYTDTDYAYSLFNHLNDKEIESEDDTRLTIICHNSDDPFCESLAAKIPHCVDRVFTTNADTDDPRVTAIPIGLENFRWYQDEYKMTKLWNYSFDSYGSWQLAYLNANKQTNLDARMPCYSYFKDKEWCQSEARKNGEHFEAYLCDLQRSKFVICPEGNGLDTHRAWEALYLHKYPVVLKSLWTRVFKDLPVLEVDDWESCTETYLEEQYKLMVNTRWSWEKLDMNYWIDLIREDRWRLQ